MFKNIIIIVLVITNLGLLIFSMSQKTVADRNMMEAMTQRTIAEEQRVLAIQNEQLAQEAQQIAEVQRDSARSIHDKYVQLMKECK